MSTPASDPTRTTVAVSDQLRAPVSTGVELCYQTFGDPADEPLVLVMGLGAPMTWWDDRLCTLLAQRGFHVIRFDNRDAGRSSRAQGRVTRATLVRAFAGLPTRAPYTLVDMADDVAGLLDHLGHDSAHVAGVSMGGMIAQTLAVEHTERVRSLTSIMSTTGRRTVGWQHPVLLPTLIGGGGTGKDAYVRQSARLWRLIGSPGYPLSAEENEQRAADTFEHGVSAGGTLRQMVAILTAPDREPRLKAVAVPSLVVHGLADRMVHPSGGRATSRVLRGSELLMIDQMGHDLPAALHETLASAIRRTADRAPRG